MELNYVPEVNEEISRTKQSLFYTRTTQRNLSSKILRKARASQKARIKRKEEVERDFCIEKRILHSTFATLLSTMALVMNIPKHIANIIVSFAPFSNGFKALNKFNSSSNAHTVRVLMYNYTHVKQVEQRKSYT